MGRKSVPPLVGTIGSPPLVHPKVEDRPAQLPSDLSTDPHSGLWMLENSERIKLDQSRLYLTKASAFEDRGGFTIVLVRLLAPFGSDVLTNNELHTQILRYARQMTQRGRQYIGLSYAFPTPKFSSHARVRVIAFVRVEQGPFVAQPLMISDFQAIDRDRLLVKIDSELLVLTRDEWIGLIGGLEPQVNENYRLLVGDDVRLCSSHGGGGYLRDECIMTIGDDFKSSVATPLANLGVKKVSQVRCIDVTTGRASTYGLDDHYAYRLSSESF